MRRRLVKRNLSMMCPTGIDNSLDTAHELIKRSSPLLNIHGSLCDTCVVVLVASQLPVGIIEHSLDRPSKSWIKYSSGGWCWPKSQRHRRWNENDSCKSSKLIVYSLH